jgi:hypothetical protein
MKHILLFFLLLPVLLGAQDWVKVTSEKHGFSVEFPGEYDLTSEEESGYSVQIYSCIDGDFSYTLSCMPNFMPDTSIREMIDGFVEEMVNLYQTWAEVRKYRRITLAGHHGVELEIAMSNAEDLPDMVVVQRSYFANGMFYILSVAFPDDVKSRKPVRRYFSSFRLLDADH